MLANILHRIDGRGYKAYKELYGKRDKVGEFEISFVKIQGDPFASPSVLSARTNIDWKRYGSCALGVEDFLYRRLHRALKKYSKRVGEGHSGFLGIPAPKNIMIRRSAVQIIGHELELRFWIGLPARHRRIMGYEAEHMIYDAVPRALEETLIYEPERLIKHVQSCEQQECLRRKLREHGLVSFIANGSLLPRRCGDCEEPLDDAVPFEAPKSLELELCTEHKCFSGLGLPRGVSVIAGTAFHGKSTLLNAIRDGIYNHVPGDGRECVVTVRNSFKVRAEDGRSVRCVDISTFVYNLPDARDTKCFTTDNASGATSMAAGIQESIEAGAELILIDEDTSATNLLFYDERADKLFKHKTVSTIVEKARDIAAKGISLVIVSSGSLPVVEAADTLIIMEDYKPRHVNINAKMGFEEYAFPESRILTSHVNIEKPKIHGSWLTSKTLSRPVRLENNEQLREESQMNMIARFLEGADMFKGMSFSDIAKHITENFSFAPSGRAYGPELAEIRGLDVVFALNRVSDIKVKR